MASLRDLKRRIKSVEGIRQITRAMEMVSATKLRRAQQRIEAARPYSDKIEEIVNDLSRAVEGEDVTHPLMEKRREVKRLLILAVASDKGLCGSFNSNVMRQVENHAAAAKKAGQEVELFLVGKKIYDHFRRRGWPVSPESEHFINLDPQLPVYVLQNLSDIIQDLFLGVKTEDGSRIVQFDQVDMIYTEFKSAIVHKIKLKQFLPIIDLTPQAVKGKGEAVRDYIFEPNARELLRNLVPKYARVMIFRMLAESLASEQGSRMTTMRNATENAVEMIDALTLQRNKARQAAITKELAEIVGGAEALTG